MSLTCPRCSRLLEYSSERPSFCAYCGQALADPRLDATTDHAREETTPYAGETVASPTAGGDDPAPERVAGYRLVRRLGRGGMGTVYEAEDAHLGRRVALKLIARGHVAAPDAVERFRQEGRLASAIAHPRCVFVLAADEEAGRPYIVMELMPGSTLQTLVEERGPLPTAEAIAKILDVIEGLEEAHHLGVIHRDVKPSNCFLEEGGRVKVGDFGLSKSLAGAAHLTLTRTGAFIGTPLYASPEQIKGAEVDPRTDVYSVAATLYFLLAGRPMFQEKDAAATLARIVSEPAPSLRGLRPDVPAALDDVVLRGLERDRERRYRDLAEFRAALLPFVPEHVRGGGITLRVAAHMVDWAVLAPVYVALSVVVEGLTGRPILSTLAGVMVFLLYYIVMERRAGSAGKLLAGLRVRDAGGNGPAGLGRVTLRTVLFYLLVGLPLDVIFYFNPDEPWWASRPYWLPILVAAEVVGYVALVATMRARDGYRGLHEVLSGTRVVVVPRQGRRRSAERRRPMGRDRGVVSRPVGVLQSVGPYRVRGAVRWEPGRKVLSVEDSTLGREAWVVLRPRSSAPPEPARRELARPTRPRWLAGGDQPEGRWDAYVAPFGAALSDLAGPEGLPWRDARPILEDLADELSASLVDGTLHEGLTVDQVWVEPDGRAVLVDPLGTVAEVGAPGSSRTVDPERALSLLRRVAALALEGGRRRSDDDATPIRAPVPLHARRILDRLIGPADRYADLATLRADLAATRELPTEVDRSRRALHVGVLALLLSIVLTSLFSVTAYILLDSPAASPDEVDSTTWAASPSMVLAITFAVVLAAWVAWSFLTRGGLNLPLCGLALVRTDGRPASRLRCAWRTLLVWVPPLILLWASVAARDWWPNPGWLPWVIFGLTAAVTMAYVPLALLMPSRGLHDRMAGTRLVPR